MRTQGDVVTTAFLVLSFATGCSEAMSTDRQHSIQDFRIERALNATLRRSERDLIENVGDHENFDAFAFADVLRKLDRGPQADAFLQFLKRNAAGVDTFDTSKRPRNEACKAKQPHANLIRSWPERTDLTRKLDRSFALTAAKFKIGLNGEIYDIDVFLARHPAAAWVAIDTVGRARISQTKLKRLRTTSPDSFPVELCAWIDTRLDWDRRYRGGLM